MIVNIFLLFLSSLICLFPYTSSYRLRSLIKHKNAFILNSQADEMINPLKAQTNNNNKQVVIEIITRKQSSVAEQTKGSKTSQNNKKVSRTVKRGAYKETKESVLEKVIDSPVTSVLGFLFNPTTLLLGLYVSSIGWNKVLWLQVYIL